MENDQNVRSSEQGKTLLYDHQLQEEKNYGHQIGGQRSLYKRSSICNCQSNDGIFPRRQRVRDLIH